MAMDEKDALSAREYFPNAQIFCVGSPLVENLAFPDFERSEVRQCLRVEDSEKLIVVAGGKNLNSNLNRLNKTFGSLSQLSELGRIARVVMSLHPGDENDHEAYVEVVKESPVPTFVFKEDVVITSPVSLDKGFDIISLVSGSDLVIAGLMGSANTASALQRVPVICVGDEVDFLRLKKEAGLHTPEIVSVGCAVLSSGENLTSLIAEYVHCNPFVKNQEREFERKKPGVATEKALGVLHEILAYK